MQLTDQQTLPVAQAQTWEALNDLALLQTCIPGCESITAAGENEYDVAVLASVGPVKARFAGKLKLADIVPPTSYALQFEAKASAGHGKGSAAVRLEAIGPRETRLHYEATATVGGKLAQIGSRLVDMAAEKMATDFFERFRHALIERHGDAQAQADEAAALAAAPHGMFGRLKAWLRRLGERLRGRGNAH